MAQRMGLTLPSRSLRWFLREVAIKIYLKEKFETRLGRIGEIYKTEENYFSNNFYIWKENILFLLWHQTSKQNKITVASRTLRRLRNIVLSFSVLRERVTKG